MTAYQPNGRNRNLRRQADEARRLAVEGRWDEAVSLNQQILEQSPRDIDALNRLGKALAELGRFDEALEAYRTALSIDSGNAIAQRNVSRLEQRSEISPQPVPSAEQRLRARVFIEEVGKTYVTDLVRPAGHALLTDLSPADEVELRPAEGQVSVYDQQGRRLGQIEPRIGQRLIKLFAEGNRYQAFVVSLTGNTVRIILRESYRNPDSLERTSFPRQAKIAAPRPYLRETGRLARELEPELLMEEEEEEEAEEEELEEVEGMEEETEEEEFRTEGSNDDEEESPLER